MVEQSNTTAGLPEAVFPIHQITQLDTSFATVTDKHTDIL